MKCLYRVSGGAGAGEMGERRDEWVEQGILHREGNIECGPFEELLLKH